MIINTSQLTLALFEVGEEASDPISFYQELKEFGHMLKDEDIHSFFCLTYDQFESVEPELSALFSREMVNFLAIVYELKVMSHFDNIIKSYREHLVEYKYLNEFEVYSAQALSKSAQESILNKLRTSYPGEYEITFECDESLLGGLYIKANEDVYDTSLKNKLNQVVKHGGVQSGKTN